MSGILNQVLKAMSRVILKRYRPQIIGVTGSVGKTSAREAIFQVLRNDFSVGRSARNFNNEVGVPLSILRVKTHLSYWKMPWLLIRWLLMIIWWPYPEILVLEMGVDHPGDMDYLLSFVPVDLAVLTDISTSHLKFFQETKQIRKEKSKLLQYVFKKHGTIAVNIDNGEIEKVLKQIFKEDLNNIQRKTQSDKVLTYGFKETAKLRASDVQLHTEADQVKGLSFKLNYQEKIIPIRLKNIIAPHQIYAVLAGLAVAAHYKLNLMEAVKGLENFSLPAGRMKLRKGIKETWVIDDSYNASPASMLAALETLQKLSQRRRVVILGDMLELGKISSREHYKILKKVQDLNVDLVILVGPRMQKAVRKYKLFSGWKNRFRSFDSIDESINQVGQLIQAGDLILIKGSRKIQLDKIADWLAVDKSD